MSERTGRAFGSVLLPASLPSNTSWRAHRSSSMSGHGPQAAPGPTRGKTDGGRRVAGRTHSRVSQISQSRLLRARNRLDSRPRHRVTEPWTRSGRFASRASASARRILPRWANRVGPPPRQMGAARRTTPGVRSGAVQKSAAPPRTRGGARGLNINAPRGAPAAIARLPDPGKGTRTSGRRTIFIHGTSRPLRMVHAPCPCCPPSSNGCSPPRRSMASCAHPRGCSSTS